MAQDLLQHIAAFTANFFAELPQPSFDKTIYVSNSVNVPPLRLAKATSIFHSEISRNDLLPQVRTLALSKAGQLATLYQDSYKQLMTSRRGDGVLLFEPVGEKLRQTFESFYENKDLPRLLSYALKSKDVLPRKLDEQGGRVNSHGKERRLFNHEYTPLLEKYFEYNAYPSSPDRLALAQKTMMTPRQIEVWFQNHRNRSKKEGRTLKRATDSLALNLCLGSLEYQMPQLVSQSLDADQRDSSDDEPLDDESKASSIPFSSPFSEIAPLHAFPTRYPPNCSEDPFPHQNGIFKFQPPSWRRSPTKHVRHAPVNVDELTVLFASKLNLREGISRKEPQRACKASHQPWFAATVYIPCRAPHPALIRAYSIPTTNAGPPISAVNSSLSSVLKASLSTPRSRSSAPESSISNHSNTKSRKIAPFPRRAPKNGISCKATTSQSPLSLTTKSRTSSCSTLASSQSRSTSSSLSSIAPIDSPSPPFESPEQALTPENLSLLSDFFGSISAGQETQSWTLSMTNMIPKSTPFMSSFDLKTLPYTTQNYLIAQS